MRRRRLHAIEDAGIIALSILAAIVLARSGVLHSLAVSLHELEYVGAFFAGMLFTSAFTTAFSIAVLGELAQQGSLLPIALVGGLGAMVGDYLIFRFVRDRVADDISYLLRHAKWRRLGALMHTRLLRYLLPLLGGLIIASPFPDELGLALLGFSKVNNRAFFTMSFVFNTAGILAIGAVARAALG